MDIPPVVDKLSSNRLVVKEFYETSKNMTFMRNDICIKVMNIEMLEGRGGWNKNANISRNIFRNSVRNWCQTWFQNVTGYKCNRNPNKGVQTDLRRNLSTDDLSRTIDLNKANCVHVAAEASETIHYYPRHKVQRIIVNHYDGVR